MHLKGHSFTATLPNIIYIYIYMAPKCPVSTVTSAGTTYTWRADVNV